jgi:serine-type D-Ala-D-Ala carboxypeptidase (penicillin-binding protein 5/6)
VRRLLVLIALLALPAAGQAAPPPEVAFEAYIVADGRDGRVLAELNADAPRSIASLTKMMTAYLSLERGVPGRSFRVPAAATLIGESSAGLRAGERFAGSELLRALMVPSANDAATTLAIALAGSERAFATEMNRAAGELGMRDTTYRTPHGLDADGQHSTAADQLILARKLMTDARLRRIVRLRAIRIRGRELPASNTLLQTYAGMDGVKTGHTSQAGWCLAASATRGGRRLFVIGLGAPDGPSRDEGIARLLDWGFAGIRRVTVVADGARAGSVPRPSGGTVDALVDGAVRITLRPGERVRVRYSLPGEAPAPLARGARIGRVEVLVDDRVVDEAPLVAAAAVASAGFGDRLSAWLGRALPG